MKTDANVFLQQVYLGAVLMELVAIVFYAVFASGEIQAWAADHPDQEANVEMDPVSDRGGKRG